MAGFLKYIQIKIVFMYAVLDIPDAALDQRVGLDNL